ncbi:putative cadmium, cobalt and zinc/H(+)-K(+) antiporter [Leptospira inadai serovar Lyme str. 10]|uniref:Cobalt transporter n=2 Tax=Leptospira inadai serovar Lyme TaxID=293084 RepID=A0ABX4YMZ8_9LEPT|nr:cation diffusion facilitator family transporter [Leptospira inadai]EQA37053.1 putative cadmium, cobalt and zinc/H(+)-K(+) antiporter [Leptospira inadai serovar Lyme str. 10]PNV76658.1 cobalt transporter [Leptospira inadai serovar Lyme]
MDKSVNSKGTRDRPPAQVDPFLNQTILRPRRKGTVGSLLMALLLSLGIFTWEIWGAAESHSLALLADAGHVISDSFALLLSLTAVLIADRKPNQRMNFGYFRVEVLAAFLNSLLIFGISAYILIEAWERIRSGNKVAPDLMLAFSLGTIVLNLISVWVLRRVADDNINLKSAYLHVLSDLLATVAVVIGAILIRYTNWNWIDPLISVLLSFLILKSAGSILKESLSILLEASPNPEEWDHLQRDILDLEGVETILSSHSWSLTKGIHACAFRLLIKTGSDTKKILTEAYSLLREEWKFEQIYLQLEDLKTTKRLDGILAKTLHEMEPEDWGHAHHNHDHPNDHRSY